MESHAKPTHVAPPAGSTRHAPALVAGLTLAGVAAVAVLAAWAGRGGAPVPAVRPAEAPPPTSTSATAPATAWAAAPPAGAALEPAVQSLLDGGNAAFRAGQYEAALAHYRAAAAAAPRHAAPWFGIHMVASKLGRAALADSALAAVRARTDAPAQWDDAAVRRAHDSTRAR